MFDAVTLGAFASGVVVGAGLGSLITFRLTRSNRVAGAGKIVDQSGARAGADIVGGDKTTTTRVGPNA